MAYRLMAADYDLTLTGSDRKVSAHTRETIRAVYAAGNFVTLASGRLGGSAEVARELFPGDVPLILGNGGLVQSCATGETLSETMMDEPTALTMLRWCRRRASAAIVYGRSGIYTDRVNAASEMYAQPPLPLPSPEEVAHEGIYKILLLGLPLTVRRAAKKLHSAPPQPVNCFASSPEALEIVPTGVNKAAGLARVAAILGIPREETIAIGDNCFDDADAFELSGLPSLKNLTVGKMAFLGKAGPFALRDCPRLEELSVGSHSFRKFRIEALENLGSLRLFHTDFSCFGGTEHLSFAGLPRLERVVMEGDACEKCKAFAVEDCPALAELALGDQSFQSAASLSVRNNPRLRALRVGGKSFPWAHEVVLEKLPALESVEIGAASFAKQEGRFGLKACESVKEVRIGSGSFASFSECVVEEVDSLEVLAMGELTDENGCFGKADLQLESRCVRWW